MKLPAGRIGTAIAVLIFVGAVGLAPLRMGVLTDAMGVRWGAQWGLSDFYSNGYYPVQAFLHGEDPYDAERFVAQYPVEGPYPLHAPLNLLLHLPFAILPPGPAGVAYFIFSALLLLVLAYLTLRLAVIGVDLRRVILLAAALALTRPGHWNLVLGQRGILLASAIYWALLNARAAPLRSGIGLAVSMAKPTFGVPFTVLMLGYGRWRAVMAGLLLSAALNLPILAILIVREGGAQRFWQVLLSGFHAWQVLPGLDPASSYSRVDAAATVSRFLGYSLSDPAQAMLTALILLCAMGVLRQLRLRVAPGPRDCAVGVICLGVLLSGYHNGYDLILLAAPFLALLARGLPAGTGPVLRWTFVGLFTIPAVNWFASESFLSAWQSSRAVWLLVSSISGLCVAALFVGYVGLSVKSARSDAVGAAPVLVGEA